MELRNMSIKIKEGLDPARKTKEKSWKSSKQFPLSEETNPYIDRCGRPGKGYMNSRLRKQKVV